MPSNSQTVVSLLELNHPVHDIAIAIEAAGLGPLSCKYVESEHSVWLDDGSQMGVTETSVRGKVIGYDVVHRGWCLIMCSTISEAVRELVARHGSPTVVDRHDEQLRQVREDGSAKVAAQLTNGRRS
jgi:hypothetical protein